MKIFSCFESHIGTTYTFYHIKVSSKAKTKSASKLILEKLKEKPEKIPKPTREEMVNMFRTAWTSATASIDVPHAFK